MEVAGEGKALALALETPGHLQNEPTLSLCECEPEFRFWNNDSPACNADCQPGT